MKRKDLAIENFKKGYNCSQSVVLAFSDLVDIDEKSLLKLSSSFGGGMGRLREVCGALSGCFIILGLLYGYENPETGDVKAKLYSRIQELGLRFEKDNNTMICRELLNLKEKHSDSKPAQRTSDFYKNRPCEKLIGYATEILEEYVDTHPIDR